MTLDGDRFVQLGNNYHFTLNLNDIKPLQVLNKIHLQLGEHSWSWDIDPSAPRNCLKSWVKLPDIILAEKPKFVLEGYDEYNSWNLQEVSFTLPIVATDCRPIISTPLSCSISPSDQLKIDPIRRLLSIWGFDYSTLGIEVEPLSSVGPDLLKSGKEWASGGDCFIAVLTERDVSAFSGRGKPPAWTHTESGFAYGSSGKPYLVFVEKGVDADALYTHLDSDHVIEYLPESSNNLLEETREQMVRFREECTVFKSNKALADVGKVVGAGLALVGGLTILDALLGDGTK